ncbi:MAG TPA: DEAD/DEAH box helicase [Egibacteraceae bacterium]
MAIKSFSDFGVVPEIVDALHDQGITTPFPIQELTLPLALSGADLIGQARTGTGKTLAFGIPLLQRVDPSSPTTQALVIVPTRELCLQVRDDLAATGANLGVEVVAAYGGKAIDPQSEAIAAGAPVVVGTPGRLLDLVRRGVLHLETVTTLVLDEADEMLDLGFLPDVEQLIEATSPQRQTLLFSATMPSAVVALARRYMHKPTFLRAEVEEPRIAPATRQYFFSCHRMDKPAVLARILQTPHRGLCVVFTRTKRMADVLAAELRERGIAAAPIHSDLRQDARERTLAKFRKGTVDVLVATEVAARGLDISDVTHVVNYDCPDDEKMYLHRIGRTGRAGAAGVAITFAVWNELARMEVIKKALDITEPTYEVFSTSPILAELFDLPEHPTRRRVAEPDHDSDDDERGSAADAGGEQGARRSRSRRRRSRRGRTGAEREATRDTATTAEAAAEPADVAAASEPAADAAEGDRDARREREAEEPAPSGEAPRRVRVRRRAVRTAASSSDGAPEGVSAAAAGRRRDAGGPDVAPATEEPAADPQEPPKRTRVRTRSRARAGATRPAPSAGGNDAAAAPAAQDAAETAAEAPAGEAAAAPEAGGSEAGAPRAGEAPSADRTPRERGGSRTGAQAAGRAASRRGSGARGSGRGSARRRRGRDRRDRPALRREQPAIDVEAARGGGKPALHRRMTILHLP